MQTLIALVAFAVVLGAAADARAIPAFARAYKVSCKTCHSTITRRNETGDAFRKAGFRWPGGPGADARARKQEPISLVGVGLLDGFVPGNVPLGASASFAGNVTTEPAEEYPVSAGLPSFKLLFGSAFGEHVSAFGTWSGGPPDELYLQVGRFFGRPELNLRAGRFEQTTTLFKRNEAILAPYWHGTSAVSGHVVSQSRLGVEANGTVLGRLFYAAGLVQNTDFVGSFDPYYHVSARIGGTDFDGTEPDIDLEEPTLLDDISLTVGHWGYFGFVKGPDGVTTSRVRRLGLEAKLQLRELSIWGGAMLGLDHDRARSADNTNVSVFGEVSYGVTSWLLPIYMYQYQDAASLQRQLQFHDVGVIVVLLENVRARLRFRFSDDRSNNELVELQILAAM